MKAANSNICKSMHTRHKCAQHSIHTMVTLCCNIVLLMAMLVFPDVVKSEDLKVPKVDISPVETLLLGQTNWLSGASGALRIIVKNHMTGKPLKATVNMQLVSFAGDKPSVKHLLMHDNTDNLGTIDARFQIPKVKPGQYTLAVDVDTRVGKEHIDQNLQLIESQRIMLTSDKPLYQPGQIIHMRSLVLDMATRKPVGNLPVVFEVEDARGNKVGKIRSKLSRFGVAGADFTLADEVNMGVFTLRTVLPSGQSEKKVRVERYVLPKFKVEVSTNKSYYSPGETVNGVIKAHYFFGKPVSGANVTVKVNTIDVGLSEIGHIDAVSDKSGLYNFTFKLPDSFVGQPFEQGQAKVEFAVEVKDTANHTEKSNKQIPVVANPLMVAIVPETANIIPGISNKVYIAVATPDGAPVVNAKLIVQAKPAIANSNDSIEQMIMQTDSLGIAAYSFKPGKSDYTIHVEAKDNNGTDTIQDKQISLTRITEGIILRPSKTITSVGDEINLKAFATLRRGTIYFDVIRDGQVIITHAEAIHKGSADIDLPITSDMVGTLNVHAYVILPNENIVRDTRTIIVSSADDLTIDIKNDKQQYRPGEDAVLKLSVMTRNHNPVASALGLAIVDESVFALSELQPGLEKIYFTLEKELMTPKYEIHGLTPVGIINRSTDISDNSRQRAAAMLMSNATPVDPYNIHVDTFEQRFQSVRSDMSAYMYKLQQKIATAVQAYNNDHHVQLKGKDSLWVLVDNKYLVAQDLVDPWGHFYKTNVTDDNVYTGYFNLMSAGPDGDWLTNDDLDMSYGFRSRGFGGGNFAMRRIDGAMDNRLALEDQMIVVGPMGMAGGMVQKGVEENSPIAVFNAEAPKPGSDAPRVRQYFPETLFWNPSLITDDNGHADIHIPMADSITTWRVSAIANDMDGDLGSTTSQIKVFQDFFVDIDLPVALTQSDKVEVPVAIYNYLSQPQDVRIKLKEEPWFILTGPAEQTLHLEPNQVTGITYTITAKSIGKHAFEVTAIGSKLSDAIRRSIEIVPDGKQIDTAINDRLDGTVEQIVNIPEGALADASKLWVKIYPGTFSQVVEGLDGILRMPNGCFEQTSSTTFPNVLVLDYLKQNKRINPELQMKAEQYINIGYQRLVTFECKNGGFSWFGNEPAHQVLTAYGLLEFTDMSKVHDVDPNLITRTQTWLAGKQNNDGTWVENNQGIAEGIINRQTGTLRTTAYIAWALAESGYKGAPLDKGVNYVKSHMTEANDPYTLAVLLNLFTIVNEKESASTVAEKLISLAKTTDKTAYWSAENTETFTGAVDKGADLETTSLAAYGFVKYGRSGSFTTKVLTYLVQNKDSFGTWGATQGTVWSMKALLYAGKNSVGGGKSSIDVYVNGEKVDTINITADDSDVMRQIDATKYLKVNNIPIIGVRRKLTDEDLKNSVKLVYKGDGSVLYQIAARYYMPWVKPGVDTMPVKDILTLKVDYDKTQLAQNDTVTVKTTIINNTDKIVNMPLIDLGVPPGFDVVPDALQDAVTKGTISKYTIAARQIIIYMEKLDPKATVELTYQLHAKYPIKAKIPASKAYPYYNPEQTTNAVSENIEVTK